MKITKRDGRVVNYDGGKIVQAVGKAMQEVKGKTLSKTDKEICYKVEEEVKKTLEAGNYPLTVEGIQDSVENTLMSLGTCNEVAKAYILYRAKRNELRKEGWEMTDLQKDIYEQKYRYGKETFDEFLCRVSDGDPEVKKAIRDKEFIPAGRILAGMGLYKDGRKVTLSNCYVLPKVEDNIESIFDTAKHLARTYSYGGGVGLNISKLRPKGAKVNNAAKTTTGAVSFMDLFSLVTELIGQHGRRGALMINIDADHPDIEEFIEIKTDLDKVTGANISVNVDNEFMEAVKDNREYDLEFIVEATGEKIVKTVEARKLFRRLAETNWDYAEPGILFKDRINSWHLMSEDDEFEFAGVNPCAEETLPAFGSCNLSSINLSSLVRNEFTDHAYFDKERFKELIKMGVRYLNHVLDINMELHPLKQQREMSRDYRQIGLGIMGLADMFIKMGIRYGSDESLEVIDDIGSILIDEAVKQSALLAKDEGEFPKMNREAVMNSPFFKANTSKETKELVKKYGLRNSQILTIAPTGSISTLIGCSNGVEPIFRAAYTRKTESLNDGQDTYYTVVTPIIEDLMRAKGIEEVEDLPDYIVTAETLSYKERIRVQGQWQQYIDASISSTVNVPNEFTVEEVEDLYMYAWENGLKGTTIYRDGCARGGILISDEAKAKDEEDNSKLQIAQKELIDFTVNTLLEYPELFTKVQEKREELGIDNIINERLESNPDECPLCSGEMIHSGGCEECQDCGYSPCSI